jgi:hypothetical protein
VTSFETAARGPQPPAGDRVTALRRAEDAVRSYVRGEPADLLALLDRATGGDPLVLATLGGSRDPATLAQLLDRLEEG